MMMTEGIKKLIGEDNEENHESDDDEFGLLQD